MSAADTILFVAAWLGLALLVAAFLLTVWRVVRGPTLPDRVVALDMLVGIVIGFIALIAIRTGFTLYIDIAIALGLVGFLATVAFARFILASKGRQGAGVYSAGAPLQDTAPAPDATHVAARGARGKSAAKSAKVAARTSGKTSAKKSPKSLPASPAVAELASVPAASPAIAPGKAAEEKPSAKSIGKPANKSASKTVSKSTSKTRSKSAEKTAGKAVTKPGKPAKGE
ncbi:Multisubunit Na+/H+ antiporter, MnhF subunit [Rhizobium sp. NFR07]|nr:Multisubunit Na+/H+ antiporter, MnhF subunit [Rhizobium sp. NFR07]